MTIRSNWSLFALNVVLAVVATDVLGVFSLGALLVAFAVIYLALWGAAMATGLSQRYFVIVWRSLRLAGYFLYELVISSVAVAKDVLTREQLSRPAIIDVPLDVKSDAEILLVTNLISLTPGTLSIDVSEDRKMLQVHAMFADDPEDQVRQLKEGMERMVREVFEV